MSDDRLEGLRAAVELSPDNHSLRLVLAETLGAEGLAEEALDHYAVLLDADALPSDELVRAGTLAVDHGRLQLAARCLEAAKRAGVMGGTNALEAELKEALVDGGVARPAVDRDEDMPPPIVDQVPAAEQITFAEVGGLEPVKKAIHRTIVLPFQRPDLYEKYGRKAGGGVLLYGPPGCGKTMLARATAGECGVPFLNVRMEDILDPMYGVSERRLHDAFTDARLSTPCVLFIDELDAIAYARRKQQGSAGRALVDQLLQELDAIGSENEGLLVLAATNAPWDVDDALKRPGRFDRVVFVSPPDVPARRAILELALRDRPTSGLDLDDLAKRTALFSGADLRALVERAVDKVIDEALDAGEDVPIRRAHVDAALRDARATTTDWLRTARNYVEFANHGGRYDDVLAFLDSPEGKAARKR
jgi:transitional endoplasmic reticulum ATPase